VEHPGGGVGLLLSVQVRRHTFTLLGCEAQVSNITLQIRYIL
jgi:hypothetical protein